MTCQAALDYLHSLGQFGTKPGLTRIKTLLNAMGDPQKNLKCIHVAGTNGKGSTAAMLDSILRAQGYTVGLCTSPYLHDFRERIQINGAMIGKDELTQRIANIKAHIDELLKQGNEHPTEFEIVIALTLQAFAEHKLDYCVIEVGLGGRWDATNVIEPPLVAAITSISYDHTEYPGDTLPLIAREKCGIFKMGSRAVASFPHDPEVRETIQHNANKLNIPIIFTDPNQLSITNTNETNSTFLYKNQPYTIAMAGQHQIQNALVAIETVETLRDCGVTITQQALRDGLANVRWSGRLQVVSQNPRVVFDVAHNPDGVRALYQSLDTLYSDREITAVVAMCSDKQAHICVPQIASRATAFYAAESKAPPRWPPTPATELAALAQPHCQNTQAHKSITQAIQTAISKATPNTVILVCGSHYMMNEARTALNDLTLTP